MTTVVRNNHSLWFDRICYRSRFLSVKLPSLETTLLFSASFAWIMHLLRKQFYRDFSHDCSETCNLSVCSLLTIITLILSRCQNCVKKSLLQTIPQVISNSVFLLALPHPLLHLLYVCVCMWVCACALVWGTHYYNCMILFFFEMWMYTLLLIL